MNSFLQKPFRYTYKNICLVLIISNICIFVVFSLLRMMGYGWIRNYFALIPPLTIRGKMFWQVFTYQFLHADIWHLIFNMLALFFFGIPLERKMGSKEFILFYLVCGTLCGIAGLAIYYPISLRTGMPTVLIGASGSIFSVMLAFAVLYPTAYIYFWGIIPIPAPILILLYAAYELFAAFFIRDNIAHSIHLFGLLWAFLYIRFRFGIRPARMWKNLFR